MSVLLNPYLHFNGDAREVLGFYHSVFGGDLTVNTYGEAGMSDDPAQADRVMHGMVRGDHGLAIMASDVPPSIPWSEPKGFSVSLSGDDEERLRGYFEALAAGGTVVEPYAKAPWGDWFGMCTDKFGTAWMVNCTPAS